MIRSRAHSCHCLYNSVQTLTLAQLVIFYRELREGDGRSTSQSSYRITVRQLESMIRLSEALARLHLSTQVTPRYVIEAHRLMKSLIIPVQQEPVVLDGGDDGGPDDGDDGNDGNVDESRQHQADDNGDSMAEAEAGGAAQPPPRRQPVAITFEKFKAIQSLIVREMRKRLDEGTDEERESGVRFGDLLDWHVLQPLTNTPPFPNQSPPFIRCNTIL